jgi:hypothetical protein
MDDPGVVADQVKIILMMWGDHRTISSGEILPEL